MSSKKVSVETLLPHYVHDARPLYSHIASVPAGHRLITFAGQVGRRLDGTTPSDYVQQVEQAYFNLSQCLSAAGARVTDIVKLTYLIVGYDPNNRLHREPTKSFLRGHLPATTLIPVPALADPQFLFEVEAIAAIPEAPLRKVDVVVVGAGLSGLQAAHDVQRAGYSCVVIEARDRVGGKTWSQDIVGGKQDVGAAWINDTNQSHMFALAERFRLKTVTQNTSGRIIMEDPVNGSFHTFPYGGVPEVSLHAYDQLNSSVLILHRKRVKRAASPIWCKFVTCSKVCVTRSTFETQWAHVKHWARATIRCPWKIS